MIERRQKNLFTPTLINHKAWRIFFAESMSFFRISEIVSCLTVEEQMTNLTRQNAAFERIVTVSHTKTKTIL